MRLVILSLLVLLLLYGCESQTNEQTTITIPIDLAKSDTLYIDCGEITWLETNDSSLIYDINGLDIVGDKMIIHSRAMVKVFAKDGRYLYDLTRKGQAPDEFLWMGSHWVSDSIYHIFDNTIGKIQKYSFEGKYLGYDTIPWKPTLESEPEEIYRTLSNHYFIVNRFYGVEPFRTVLAYADSIGALPHQILGRSRLDGLTTYNRVSVDPNSERVIYWEPLNDTLYTATPERIEPTFYFDFGNNRLPREITSIVGAQKRFKALAETKDDNLAGPIRYAQFYGNDIYFLLPAERTAFICSFNEATHEVKATRMMTPPSQRLLSQAFFKIEGDYILLSVIDENQPEANPGLLKFGINSLQ